MGIKTEKVRMKELGDLLSLNSIDLNKWGKGEAKTLKHLFNEIESGESFLEKNKDGKLIRKVVSVAADIFYFDEENDKILKLVEEKQVFSDGRVRKRDFMTSVSEKMHPCEAAVYAIERCIEEELKVGVILDKKFKGIFTNIIFSSSYPGLQSRYTNHIFEVVFNFVQFRREGYIEIQPDKKTYFVWKEIKNFE